jgi:SAM-dependent methyltransferase
MSGSYASMGATGAATVGGLAQDDVTAFDAFVVPRYFTLFGESLLEMLADGRDAQVVHAYCRTGYPDRALATRLQNAHLFSCDPSPWALSAARAKAKERGHMVIDYRAIERPPFPFPDGAFSHAVSIHPPSTARARRALIEEFSRLLAPRGQILLALPMRGSFVEVADLLREYAVRFERIEINRVVDGLVAERPTHETLAAEVEKAGFHYVDVDVRPRSLKFANGRDFVQHPIARLMVLPEWCEGIAPPDFAAAITYMQNAIDKYWAGHAFELTLKIGCVSARKKA